LQASRPMRGRITLIDSYLGVQIYELRDQNIRTKGEGAERRRQADSRELNGSLPSAISFFARFRHG
jgi:hypothetical protein